MFEETEWEDGATNKTDRESLECIFNYFCLNINFGIVLPSEKNPLQPKVYLTPFHITFSFAYDAFALSFFYFLYISWFIHLSMYLLLLLQHHLKPSKSHPRKPQNEKWNELTNFDSMTIFYRDMERMKVSTSRNLLLLPKWGSWMGTMMTLETTRLFVEESH